MLYRLSEASILDLSEDIPINLTNGSNGTNVTLEGLVSDNVLDNMKLGALPSQHIEGIS